MTVTVEITDQLLDEVRKLASREGVTLSMLVERGLSHIVCEAEGRATFKLRHAAFKGQGLQTEFRDMSWEKLKDAAYEGHGG